MAAKAPFADCTRKLTLAALRALGSLGVSTAAEVFTRPDKVVAMPPPDPDEYSTDAAGAHAFAHDYLAQSLVRKLDCLDTGINTEQVAWRTWVRMEESCGVVNRLGRTFSPLVPLRTPFEAIIQMARFEMERLLGKFSYDKVVDNARFSSGASTRLKRDQGHPFYKFSGRPQVTHSALPAAVAFARSDPTWREYCQMLHGEASEPSNWFECVPGGYLTTVPKDATTDRMIVIEPEMNMLLQKGVGYWIRKRLKAVGINLNDQSINQRLALIGSLTGDLATVDLSSASDSISYRIVRELLPSDWFDWLDRIRCHRVDVSPRGEPPKYIGLEKFSSMGNGFTFELESAIFYCLTRAVVKHLKLSDQRIGIYGDDIVCHVEAVPLLDDVFRYIGFTLNARKSFWSGPFRESCGKHYFRGVDVTPFFVKHSLDSVEQLYWFINSLRNWIRARGSHPELESVRKYAIRCLPNAYRQYCPESFGLKAGIHADWDEARPQWCRKRRMWKIRIRSASTKTHEPSGRPALLAALASGYQLRAEPVPWRYKQSGRTSHGPIKPELERFSVPVTAADCVGIEESTPLEIKKGKEVWRTKVRYIHSWC